MKNFSDFDAHDAMQARVEAMERRTLAAYEAHMKSAYRSHAYAVTGKKPSILPLIAFLVTLTTGFIGSAVLTFWG